MIEVKIKPDKYGEAIGLLLHRREGFQTRFPQNLIVTLEQKAVLEKAGFVASNGATSPTRKGRGKTSK
jgi:hypothetical protein